MNTVRTDKGFNVENFTDVKVIFGFNGSGKSTLSDIFYSLSFNERISDHRKTLDKDNGQQAGDMKIIIETEDGDVTYSENDLWDKEIETLAFNQQYIDKYMLVGDKEGFGKATVQIGKEGVKLEKSKIILENQMKEDINLINTFILSNKEISGVLEFGKRAISEEHKNIEKISSVKLLSLRTEEKEKNEMWITVNKVDTKKFNNCYFY